MKQSLPGIVSVSRVLCSSLAPNITEQFLSHIPVSLPAQTVRLELCGNASCEAEQEYVNGGYTEKTVLQFHTTEDIDGFPPLAFVVTDAQGQSYVIGTREKPYPMVEVTKVIDKDTDLNSVKVTFTRRKSLVPCVI